LFNNETDVLERVSRGDLSRTVPVATRDEFGVIAGHTNSMIRGLRHRTKLITALKLAEEVQQNFLPVSAPDHAGLDLNGTSIYYEETGGDYYEFFKLPKNNLGVVVADASDHGVRIRPANDHGPGLFDIRGAQLPGTGCAGRGNQSVSDQG
jgi:sigma-B regulation protein RsbU (phosphoserine phosphatase)